MLPWGDSSKLKVAEWVLAIGNPFQLNQTVTLGIVSATGRSLEGRLAAYEDFIQTDAAINPGNSGGALINARGELVGINTAIFSESGGYQGIGFAVPSNLAQPRHGRPDQVRRGAARHDPRHQGPAADDADGRSSSARPNTRGALVCSVDAAALRRLLAPASSPATSSSASTARRSTTPSQFIRLLSDATIGSTVTLGLLRRARPARAVAVTQATGAWPTNRPQQR